MRTWTTRLAALVCDEAGTTTVEYAMVVVGAATLAGALIAVVSTDTVKSAIESIIQSALSV